VREAKGAYRKGEKGAEIDRDARSERKRPVDYRKKALIAVGRTAPNNKVGREKNAATL